MNIKIKPKFCCKGCKRLFFNITGNIMMGQYIEAHMKKKFINIRSRRKIIFFLISNKINEN